MNKVKTPTRAEFDAAAKKLRAAGWEKGATMMADDAHKPGVENFGTCWHKGGMMFWLNFKTAGSLPA